LAGCSLDYLHLFSERTFKDALTVTKQQCQDTEEKASSQKMLNTKTPKQ